MGKVNKSRILIFSERGGVGKSELSKLIHYKTKKKGSEYPIFSNDITSPISKVHAKVTFFEKTSELEKIIKNNEKLIIDAGGFLDAKLISFAMIKCDKIVIPVPYSHMALKSTFEMLIRWKIDFKEDYLAIEKKSVLIGNKIENKRDQELFLGLCMKKFPKIKSLALPFSRVIDEADELGCSIYDAIKNSKRNRRFWGEHVKQFDLVAKDILK